MFGDIPQRSPPRLFTVAACGSLKPTPDGRLRGAHPHLLCSSALPLLVVHSRHTLIEVPGIPRLRRTPPQLPGEVSAKLLAPNPDALKGDHDAPLGQDQLDI